MCFGTAAFDTDTCQRACYFISEGRLSSIQGYDYFVCRVNRFRVVVDFVRDPNKFQIL